MLYFLIFLGLTIFGKMRVVAYIAAFTVLYSCESELEKNIYAQESFSEFINLHCQARRLKNQRFELADSIRKEPKENTDWQTSKAKLAEQSRVLADSIRQRLNLYTRDMSLEAKRAFNDSVQSRISNMGCE